MSPPKSLGALQEVSDGQGEVEQLLGLDEEHVDECVPDFGEVERRLDEQRDHVRPPLGRVVRVVIVVVGVGLRELFAERLLELLDQQEVALRERADGQAVRLGHDLEVAVVDLAW